MFRLYLAIEAIFTKLPSQPTFVFVANREIIASSLNVACQLMHFKLDCITDLPCYSILRYANYMEIVESMGYNHSYNYIYIFTKVGIMYIHFTLALVSVNACLLYNTLKVLYVYSTFMYNTILYWNICKLHYYCTQNLLFKIEENIIIFIRMYYKCIAIVYDARSARVKYALHLSLVMQVFILRFLMQVVVSGLQCVKFHPCSEKKSGH